PTVALFLSLRSRHCTRLPSKSPELTGRSRADNTQLPILAFDGRGSAAHPGHPRSASVSAVFHNPKLAREIFAFESPRTAELCLIVFVKEWPSWPRPR